jgi:hypothetical protein
MPFVSAGPAPEGDDVEEVEDIQEGGGEAAPGTGQTAIAVQGARGEGVGATGAEVDGAPKPAIASSQARRKSTASGRR